MTFGKWRAGQGGQNSWSLCMCDLQDDQPGTKYSPLLGNVRHSTTAAAALSFFADKVERKEDAVRPLIVF